jgi:YHS domain-containing protein
MEPKEALAMQNDPVCGMRLNHLHAATQLRYGGKMYYFCSPACAAEFEQTPERYATPDRQPPGRFVERWVGLDRN